MDMIFLENLANNSENIEKILTNALNRHIPKQVEIESWYGTYACPVCHKIVCTGNYCRWCGQRIEFPGGK